MKAGSAMANAISIVFSCPGYSARARRDRHPLVGHWRAPWQGSIAVPKQLFIARGSRRGANAAGRRLNGRTSKSALNSAPVTFSSLLAGTQCQNDIAFWAYALQEFEKVAVRGQDEGRVFGDKGLVGLHGPRELIERHRFRTLVVGRRVDFGRLRVRHAADLLDLPVGFGLDLVHVAQTTAADSGGLAVAFRQEAFRDLPPFADHPVVDLRTHAFVVVDPLEPDIEQLDAEHANLLGRLGEDLLLDLLASLLDRHKRPHVQRPPRVGRQDVAQRYAILGGADDLDQLMFGDGVAGPAAEDIVEAGLSATLVVQPQKVLQRIDDAPAGEKVDRDVELVLGRHVGRIAIPLENPLVDQVDVLDE